MNDYTSALNLIANDAAGNSSPNSNNAGNLRQPGAGKQPFQTFGTPEAGLQAMDNQLQLYGKRGINTVEGLVSTYAPAGDGANDPAAYAAFVRQKAGLKPGQQIDLSNPLQRAVIQSAMLQMEKGNSAIFGQQNASNNTPSPYTPALNLIAQDGTQTAPVAAPQPTPAAAPQPTTASTPAQQTEKPSVLSELRDTLGGLAEIPTAAVGSMAGASAGGLRALYDIATGKGVDQATKDIHDTEAAVNKLTAPQTKLGQEGADLIGIPSNLLAKAGDYVGSKVANVSPTAGALINAGIQVAPILLGAGKAGASDVVEGANKLTGARDIIPENLRPTPNAVEPESAYGSAGAAGANPLTVASAASPDLQIAVEQAIKKGDPINNDTLAAHVEAESLPVPVKLTAGQASGDIHLLSQEQNARATMPEIASRFDEQNQALKDNLPAIRESVAPDVYDRDHVEMGQGLIDAYQAKDAALRSNIDAQYQALRDANGGDFPVDAGALYNNIANVFKKQLNSAKLSDGPVGAQIRELHDLAENGSMTMEQYLALRKNLGDIARTASDGTDRAMASAAVQQMEELPLQGGAADLKPMADAARQAARQRFDLIQSDPAYKAAISGAAPDNFLSKYVINAPVRGVEAMRENLADDPLAQQRMAAAVVDHLRNAAGFQQNGQWNFKADAYNKALDKLGPKIPALGMMGQAGESLQALGNVARRTTFQPRGTYINNSNTLVANLKGHAGNLLTGAADHVIPYVPIGSMIRKTLANRSHQKAISQSLAPGAGISRLTGQP